MTKRGKASYFAFSMDILILGAGYATRLYPLTLNQPKPLLPVGGKRMLEHVLDNMVGVGDVENIIVVTNAKFTPHFEKWAEGYHQHHYPEATFKVLNDHSTDDSNKLGAIGDIHFVLKKENLKNDLIVVAGDNLFDQSLAPFGAFCQKKNAPVLGVYDVGSVDIIRNKYGCITSDAQGCITSFEEKPEKPKSTFVGIALYYYPASTLPLIEQYIAEGNNPDQPGRLIQWLYPRTPVYTWSVPGQWFDIGSKETLEEADRIFSASKK